MSHYSKLVFFCLFIGIPILTFTQVIHQKAVLLEEFTSVNTEEAAEQSKHLDSIAKSFSYGKVLRIKYHTDFEGADLFYDASMTGVDKRLEKYSFIDGTPQLVMDGSFRPEGSLPLGSPSNLTRDDVWDQLQLDPPVLFFGIGHDFSEDYKEVFISGGGVTSTTSSARVYYTQAIVEEIVDLDEPVGPDDQIRFDFVFRGFAKYRKAFDIPANGSTHGWDLIDVPENIKRRDNFAVVHIFEDENGKVLNCVYDPPYDVDEQKLITSFPVLPEESYHQTFIQPELKIQNMGAWAVSEFHIAIERADTFIIDTVYHELNPLEEFIYLGDSLFLPSGKHTIGLYLKSIANQLPEAKISRDGKSMDYFLYGDHDLPDENFELNAGIDGAGDFMVKDKNEFSFINVSSDTFDLEEPVGAFGMSERCLMVDFFNWPFDDQNAANNYSYLLYGRFDMPYMDVPKMKFDVAFASNNNFYKILELTIRSNNRTKQYIYRENHLATMPEQATFMKPDSNLKWKTITIDMHEFMGDEDITLQFRVNNRSKKFNALYLDNIRVLDEKNFCAQGGLHITRQTQIDSFKIEYGECNIIQGDLCIGNCDDLTENDIVNLAGLSNLSIIEGNLSISGLQGLEYVNHLSQLQQIEGDLAIHGNPDLINLRGFNGLYDLGGNVEIYDNARLYEVGSLGNVQEIPGNLIIEGGVYFDSFEGLENIKSIGGDLVFRNLARPFFFDELDSLAYVGGSVVLDSCARMLRTFTLENQDTLFGDLIIDHSPSLSKMNILPKVKYIDGSLHLSNVGNWQLESFESLEEINGDLVLMELLNLKDLSKFSSLQRITGDLIIERADSLEHIDELLNLVHVGGTMIIHNNPSLISLQGIGNLDSLSLTINEEENASLVIRDNPILSICENTFVCNFLDNRFDEAMIENNDIACGSVDDVIASCIVGVGEASDFVKVYPNPVNDFLNIDLNKKTIITLSDINGRKLVRQELIKGTNKIDLLQLEPGLYLLRIEGYEPIKVVKN